MDTEKEIAARVKSEMWSLRSRLAADPDAEPVWWAIPGQLAVGQRPLRDHPTYRDLKPLPPAAGPLVLRWIEKVTSQGIRTVICLLHSKELGYYDGLVGMEEGLFHAYARAGLQVSHLPWPDPAHAKTPEIRAALLARVVEIKVDALAAFSTHPKPVLLHCSAAIDRSTPVAAFIVAHVGPTTAA